MGGVVVDVAGGDLGGAGRWRHELDRYVADRTVPAVIGRGRRLTTPWLLRRERMAGGADIVVAPNNVSFAISGTERRVLLRNALHFLYPDEEHLLARMPRAWRVRIPVVRGLLARADLVVVPCSAMADRVVHHVPRAARRLVVRPHPVTPLNGDGNGDGDGDGDGARSAETPFILVPVVPAPYKNVVDPVRSLVAAADAVAHPARVHVTCEADDLPIDLVAHPRVRPIGVRPHRRLVEVWRAASAAFFPPRVEAFGFPLAESRVYGVPVIAPDSAQSREIAGPALRGYDPRDPGSLVAALLRTAEPVAADPDPFDPDSYFAWLLGPGGDRSGERG